MRKIILIINLLFFSVSFSLQAQVEKISSELQARMDQAETEELIPIVIVMDQQPSLSVLQGISPQKQKQERRRDIVSYLRNTASTSQMGLNQYLQLRKNEGKTKDLKFLWLTNVVAVKTQKAVITKISDRSDVRMIMVDHAAYALADVTWNVQKIQADQVWSDFGYKGNGVLVSVLDTGIDYGHSDLHSNMWQNLGEDVDGDGHTLEYVSGQWILDPGDLNGVDDDGNGYIDDLVGYEFSTYYDPAGYDPMDDHDHGTHVSGTVAGDGTGGTQTGVAPEAKLMACKVLDSGMGYESEVWEAIGYSVDNGADVMNLSIGFIHNYHISTCDTSRQYWRQNCDNAIASGVTMVVAAGNERDKQGWPWYNPPPDQIRTPGDVPSVITVGATDISDNIASFSSAGPTTWGCVPGYYDYPYPPGLIKPDLSAPGVNITSTQRGGGYVGGWNGTSMATPATSSTVALMLEAASNMTPQMAKDILEATALDLGATGKDSLYGSGRIDAYKAINSLKSGTITNNETWSDIALVYGNVTVNSGVTLTIDPGTVVYFESGKRLRIYGTLIAVGTAGNNITFTRSGTSGSWYGIRFENSSVDADCIIKFANIEYATYGVYCYYAGPNIFDNTFTNNYYGMYLNRSNATIERNTVTNDKVTMYYSDPSFVTNLVSGQVYLNNSDPYMDDNRLMQYHLNLYRSSPFLIDNTIEGSGIFAVYAQYYSLPEFGQESPSIRGYNRLGPVNDLTTLYAINHSQPFLGTGYDSEYQAGGYNTVLADQGADLAATDGTSIIEADYTWWGEPSPSPGRFSGNVIHGGELSSIPFPN